MNNLVSYQHQKNMTHKVNLHTKLLHNIGPANNTVMEESNKKTHKMKQAKKTDVFPNRSMQQLVKHKCS